MDGNDQWRMCIHVYGITYQIPTNVWSLTSSVHLYVQALYTVQVLLWSDHSFAGEMIWRGTICTSTATYVHLYMMAGQLLLLLSFITHRWLVMTLILTANSGRHFITSFIKENVNFILKHNFQSHKHLPSLASSSFSTSSWWYINVHLQIRPLGRPMPVSLILIWQKFSHWQPSWPETFF